jgi:hypothetical protein
MKNMSIVTMILILGHCAFAQNPLPDSLLFTTQEQINNFHFYYPGCTEVSCNVWIEGENITNLNGLSFLTCIDGNLCIKKNSSLTSLAGLDNLTHIGNLVIKNNDQLVNLVGLESLDTVHGTLKIWFNDLLKDLSGLNNMAFVEHDLLIEGNFALENCHGLENLDSVGGSLVIGCVAGWMHHNRAIKSLSGFDNLKKVEDFLWINCNDSLTNLNGLESLHYVGKGIIINDNKCLETLTGLEHLTSCGGCLIIGGWGDCEGNQALTSLSGIQNIDPGTITELRIKNNPSLSDCHLKSICGFLARPDCIVEISNNAVGCNSKQKVKQLCSEALMNEISVLDQLDLYPNPFIRTTTLAYDLHKAAKVKVSVIDNLGVEVYHIVKNQNQGHQEVSINLQGLPSGLYNCLLIAGDVVKNIKLIKL